jgi:predicted transcriptional regulator
MAGAPVGNQNASKGKRFATSLAARIEELNAMKGIIDALINKAIDGDMAAIKEIADRTDGKAVQQIEAHLTAHEAALNDLK